MSRIIYFNDNFFSSGRTVIYNTDKEKIGELDLKSAFSTSVDILDVDGNLTLRGFFPFLSNKWSIVDVNEVSKGILKTRFALFKKLFEYVTRNGEGYLIESEAFSKQFTVTDSNKRLICEFRRVDGFFQSPAYRLTNYSDIVPAMEWVAVVMGVHAIQKRRNNSAAANSH
ncbi:hypothetical protein [Ornithinibacillus xuwenensis]|uniref:Tubby C 2 n=1 Tax=Ornithinibacillus xuwenensis TaxID=3144668 RepID=A0ABU9XKE6_9BACI